MSRLVVGERLEPLASLASALGAPGAIIGALSLVAFGFSLVVLVDEYHHPTQAAQAALRQTFEGWVRSDDYLGYTLVDRAERWSRANVAAERDRAGQLLQRTLDDLGGVLAGDDPRFRLVRVDRLTLGQPGHPPLATWQFDPSLTTEPPSDSTGLERVVVLPDEPPSRDRIELLVAYHVNAPVASAIRGIETSYHRLILALLGLSGYSLLCLGYMARHAQTQRDRAAREAAAAATLDLADRTCHELGNVAFVVANERRNLAGHIELLERFVDEDAAALGAAAERAGMAPALTARLVRALRREYAERGIDPEFELKGSAAIARQVCQQIATCSDYIALTVRELDGHLRRAGSPIELGPVQLHEIIADALALLAPRIEAAGVDVRVESALETPAPVVRADRRLLIHALVNLIKNAIEAVSGTDRPEVRVEVGMDHDSPTTATLTVADNGPGIDASRVRRIFDPGFTTKSAGRGLGLAIVREAIHNQGGTLAIASRPGVGTSFRITLPVHDLTTAASLAQG